MGNVYKGDYMRQYYIRDPIHGFIEFNEWEKTIINSPEFQRLGRIKQLSLLDMERFDVQFGKTSLQKIIGDRYPWLSSIGTIREMKI